MIQRRKLLLGRVFPTVQVLERHVIIAVPKITVWLIVAGLGLAFLVSACQAAMWTMD